MSVQQLFAGPDEGPGDDRLPPQDVHAERSVLGGMLLSKDAIADSVELLRGADFYRPAHESIYEAILDLYGRGEPADAITVADELTKRGELTRVGGQAYLHQLISSVPTAANAGYYAQIVAERAVLRRLVEAGTKIVQLGFAQGGGDVEDIVNAAQAEVYAVSDKRGGEDYNVLGDILEMTVDEIEVASGKSGQMTGVPTGFTDLDQLTNGLHPGQMIVVAARPAMGKALAFDTPLRTPDGWTTMGEVAVGDRVLGGDGRPTEVVGATEVMAGRPCYEVAFSDGSVLVADAEHQWRVALFGQRHVLTTEGLADLMRRRVLTVVEREPAPDATVGYQVWKVEAVRPVASVPVRCIEVAAPDHLYLAGTAMVPTHNSTLGLDIARSAAIRHRMASVLFSLEMSKTEITMRLLSAEAQIQLQHMRKGTMRDDDWQRLAATMGRVSDAPLFIDDSPNMSLMEIRAKCRRLKQRNDLKLVVIDYLQLMTSGKRVESRQQEVSEFSRALKLLAKELEVPVIAISQLNRGPEQRTDKRPQMSDLRESGCLTADTRVLRADTGAETTLGALHTAGTRDVPVWALDESLRYVRRHLTHVFPTGIRPVFKLTLGSGKVVRATENHPFLTYAGWAPLRHLRTGTSLAVPRHVPAPAWFEPWDDARVILLARLLGDCDTGRHGRARPRHRDARRQAGDWLDELGVARAKPRKRRVPTALCHAPKRQIALFVSQLWAAGGWVSVTGDTGRVAFVSPSRQLVDDVSRLLLRFGISTRVRLWRKGARGLIAARPAYRLDIVGDDSQRRFLQEIGVVGRHAAAAEQLLELVRSDARRADGARVEAEVWEQVRDLMSDVRAPAAAAFGPHDPSRERLGRMVAVLDSADLDLYAVNDVLWDPVVSVEPDGVEQVYDATVLGGHNFIANGIAVHNSIEQDADMVILLHREEAYERESQRAGEADLIVAKHRNGPTDTIVVAFQGHYSRFTNMAQAY
ncbi:MAG: replicative DNA helicase [Dermatophilaceae bacterium]